MEMEILNRNQNSNEKIKSDEKKGLGYVLKLLRIANDMTIKELAEKMEISAAYISEIESENRNPSLAMLSKYSEILGVKKSVILYFEEKGEECDYNYQKLLLEMLRKIADE